MFLKQWEPRFLVGDVLHYIVNSKGKGFPVQAWLWARVWVEL